MIRTSPIFIATLFALSACATAPLPANVPPDRLGLQPPPDTCGASRYAHLLGRPVSEAPPAGSISSYRIATSTGPITADHVPERLNIFYDEASGRIVGIRCG